MTHEELEQALFDKILEVEARLMAMLNAQSLRLSTLDHQINQLSESSHQRFVHLEGERLDASKALARIERKIDALDALRSDFIDLKDLMKVWARHGGDDGK